MASPTFDESTVAQKPEDWPRLFERHLNAGDLEAVVALYEPDARFVTESGEILVGRDRIREVLSRLIDQKTRLSSDVCQVVAFGDVALLYTNFHGTTIDVSGNVVDFTSRAIEHFASGRMATGSSLSVTRMAANWLNRLTPVSLGSARLEVACRSNTIV